MAGEKFDKSVLRKAEEERVKRRSALKNGTGAGTKTVSFADEGYSLHTFFSSRATTVAAASVTIGTIAGMIASHYNLLD